MTVSELIATWTPEERARFADLILECSEREQSLRRIRIRMEEKEKELTQGMDHLISRLARLARGAQACNTYLQEIYLKRVRPKGSA